MPYKQSNNIRIAKNTIILYFRMLFTMMVGLYTSRVVLKILGIEDYGIYNVIGGVIAMMGILNNAMAVSSQRYLTFELGKNNQDKLKLIFNLNLTIYIILSILFLLLAETIGLWFLNNKLVIPDNRLIAANYVYQFSIFSCILGLMQAPYNACIIAHENMRFYAIISIAESLMKLLILYLLIFNLIDKLIFYGLLLLIISCIIFISYYLYCKINYKECKYKFLHDKKLFKEILYYSGWNLFGSTAGLAKEQGLNILINMFFNPTINAARAIAYQVNSVVSQFFTSFYTSVRPQITKYYAQNDLKNMLILVYRSTKLICFLILFISIPILIETPYIINLWLGMLPEYVVPFIRIIILISIVDNMSNPLMTTAHATGKIKIYQFIVGMMNIMIIPISYLFLSLGSIPTTVFWISLAMSILCFTVRIFIVNNIVDINLPIYCKTVLLRCAIVFIISIIVPYIFHKYMQLGVLRLFVVCIISFMSTSVSFFLIGLNNNERLFLLNFIKKRKLI